MKKYILLFSMAALLSAGVQSVSAAPSVEIVESEFQEIGIGINDGQVLRVTGAAGQMLSIYNVTGVKVMCFRVDGSDKSYNLNLPKGCYIIKVGNVVRKVSIR